MQNNISELLLTLRKFTPDDIDWLFELGNDPVVRSNSIHNEPINRVQHKSWFHESLEHPDIIHYIAVDGSGSRTGQVWFCKENNNFIISISIHRKYCGKGLAKTMLELACEELEHAHFFKGTILAYIEKHNKSSIKVIVDNKFDYSGEKMIDRKMNYLI